MGQHGTVLSRPIIPHFLQAHQALFDGIMQRIKDQLHYYHYYYYYYYYYYY